MKNNIKFPYKVNICYIINKNKEILVLHKSRGFGKEKWNGSGGKIENATKYETVCCQYRCAKRYFL